MLKLPKVRICGKNLSSALVFTDTPKTDVELINIHNFESITKNNADNLGSTKLSHPGKKAKEEFDGYCNHQTPNLLPTLRSPLRIQCNYGREFFNMFIRDLYELYGTNIGLSRMNHLQSNGSKSYKKLKELTKLKA